MSNALNSYKWRNSEDQEMFSVQTDLRNYFHPIFFHIHWTWVKAIVESEIRVGVKSVTTQNMVVLFTNLNTFMYDVYHFKPMRFYIPLNRKWTIHIS